MRGIHTIGMQAQTSARVRFRDGVDVAAAATAGRVKLSGKITKLPRKCPAEGFTSTVTVKKVDVKPAKTAGADEARDADEAKKANA